MTECAVGGAQDALTQDAAMRVHQRERGVVADGPDVAEMVGEPLELCEQGAQPNRAIRHRQIECRLTGPRKRVSIGDSAVARDPSGELDGAFEIGAGHQPLDTLVGISEPLFQPDHGLATGREAEMSGLDDSRMDGTDCDLVHPVALHGKETVGRSFRRSVDASAQWEAHAPTIVVKPGAAIGRALRR